MKLDELEKIFHQLGSSSIKRYRGNGLLVSCPFARYKNEHKSRVDRHPSMVTWIGDEGEVLCKCWCCKESGTLLRVIDLFGDLSSTDVSELKRFIRLDGKTDIVSRIKKTQRMYDEIPDEHRFKSLHNPGGSPTGPQSGFRGFGFGHKAAEEEEVEVPESEIEIYKKMVPQYVINRGISIELAKEWEIGWADPLLIKMKGQDGVEREFNFGKRVVIPVRDYNGKLVGWSSRAVNSNSKPKYVHKKGAKLSRYLYGENKIDKTQRTGYLVEGFFDVLHLTKLGYKNALGVMSGHVSENQIIKLATWFDEVVVVPDGDDAGLTMARVLKEDAKERIRVRITDSLPGLDPADLTPDVAKQLIDAAQ